MSASSRTLNLLISSDPVHGISYSSRRSSRVSACHWAKWSLMAIRSSLPRTARGMNSRSVASIIGRRVQNGMHELDRRLVFPTRIRTQRCSSCNTANNNVRVKLSPPDTESRSWGTTKIRVILRDKCCLLAVQVFIKASRADEIVKGGSRDPHNFSNRCLRHLLIQKRLDLQFFTIEL